MTSTSNLVRESEAKLLRDRSCGSQGWSAEELQTLLGGEWLNRPGVGWTANHFSIRRDGGDLVGEHSMFIAIDEETWLRGTQNTGAYARWVDTHSALPQLHGRCCGTIVQRPVEGLPADFPMLLVGNSYDVIDKLARSGRERLQGKVIAITGTVGKSTIKAMLDMLLAQGARVVATHGNHNTRTGVRLTLANCVKNPDFAVVEVAISALWMRPGGIGPQLSPHIAVISEIGLGQVRASVQSTRDTARFKARICDGIMPGGFAVLNRDMEEFDFVCAEATRYGAEVVTYGFHPHADFRVLGHEATPTSSRVHALIGGQEVEYRLGVPGRGMISNSLAALAVISLLGKDVAAAARLIADYRSAGRLESRLLSLPGGGEITLLDDSYNAEILSMKAAFEVAALYPADSQHRRIAVLGRIINLGNQSAVLHASLLEPLLAAGFNKVFLHGEQMRPLQERLPREIDGGLFRDAPSLVNELVSCIRDGDTVLVKGSVRDSDFGAVPGLMAKALETASAPFLPAGAAAGVLVDPGTGERLSEHNASHLISPRHLSQLLLLVLCAERLADGKLRLHDVVTTPPLSRIAIKGAPIVGLSSGDKLTVSELIRAIVVYNARDAAIALAKHICGTATAALKELRSLAGMVGMKNTVLSSVSGRDQKGQQTTLDDISRLVTYLYRRHPHYLHWFTAADAVVGGKLFRSAGNLVASGRANFAFGSGGDPRWGFAISRIGGRDVLACAAGAHDAFNLDYRLDKLLASVESQNDGAMRARPPRSATMEHPVTGKRGAPRINILGDTYFGEWYTSRRRRQGRDDALTRYGYDHSFKKLTPLLEEGDFNIVNFEAALSSSRDSEMKGRKPFVLTGDPEASVAALKRNGVHAVALANNHAMDAGVQGLEQALEAFDSVGIGRFGAGLSAEEAETPLVLRVGERRFKFFSAYWYRRYMELDCAYYALPRRGGAACLSGGLLDQIRAEKQKADPATIVVLAHWGVDFCWTDETQRSLAGRIMEAGADLIVGSGPHMLGEFVQHDGRWVVFSIGNGVFNSDGEYKKRKVPPFGFVAQLFLDPQSPQLRLYPIYTDNLDTFWQPRPVDAEEFEQVLRVLFERGVVIGRSRRESAAFCGQDAAGRSMIVLPLHRLYA